MLIPANAHISVEVFLHWKIQDSFRQFFQQLALIQTSPWTGMESCMCKAWCSKNIDPYYPATIWAKECKILQPTYPGERKVLISSDEFITIHLILKQDKL